MHASHSESYHILIIHYRSISIVLLLFKAFINFNSSLVPANLVIMCGFMEACPLAPAIETIFFEGIFAAILEHEALCVR